MIFEKIKNIKDKHQKLILGLMSGTSLDGLDIALCQLEGYGLDTKVNLIAFETMGYEGDVLQLLHDVCFKEEAHLSKIASLNIRLARFYAKCVNDFLKNRNIDSTEIDILASHGQTIYHTPGNIDQLPETLQLGDGDVLARETGIFTISDFRMKHLAHGGEGAPLAPYGDVLLFGDDKKDRLLFNIGGISNFTYVPRLSTSKKISYSDIGPGNTLMNQWAQKMFSIPYDDKGQIAKMGKVDKNLLHKLLEDPFYKKPFPKTTGPEYFKLKNIENMLVESLASSNVMSTLNMLTAEIVSQVIHKFCVGEKKPEVFVSGGGAANDQLIKNIKALCPDIEINFTLPHDITYESKESVFFALLANEVFSDDVAFYKDYGLIPVQMGKISLP